MSTVAQGPARRKDWALSEVEHVQEAEREIGERGGQKKEVDNRKDDDHKEEAELEEKQDYREVHPLKNSM